MGMGDTIGNLAFIFLCGGMSIILRLEKSTRDLYFHDHLHPFFEVDLNKK